MVAGIPNLGQSGYNQNVGPVIGTLTPNLVNGAVCNTISRNTTPNFFMDIAGVQVATFFNRIVFQSTDVNWNLKRFLAADAQFSNPGGRSQWLWSTAEATIPAAFIQDVIYECDIR